MSQKWEDTAFKGPMARAMGLGSAHTGLHHWMGQKMTALANIPLVLWVVWSFVSLAGTGAQIEIVQAFFAQPVNAIMMLLFLCSVFYHMALGLQVVIEDYVHCSFGKPFMLVMVKLFSAGLFVASAFSVLKLALGFHVTDIAAVAVQM
ncbi:MAG: succinate dehydrogenase, hydrophobic membrane anchor protein [Pseudobdellovibrionaceae bacterium]|jgi:succinate dehydrogenase / fumarate reductase membrane anchor subunit|nr:succinate dehydrogenase, hydrophobic membrane anchor protein [Pseudobdellovibrionaceae bacterium]